MKTKIFAVGDEVRWLGEDISELKTGFILDVKSANTFLVTDDEKVIPVYSDLEDKDRYDYIKESPLGQIEEASKNRVLSASDKRTKKYDGFYRCINSRKYSTFIDTKKELDKFFAKGNSITLLKAKIKTKRFFMVYIFGLFQFIIGDAMQYFVICRELYIKDNEIRKYSQGNRYKKDPVYQTLLQEQEVLKDRRNETRRAFITLIVSVAGIIVSIIGIIVARKNNV